MAITEKIKQALSRGLLAALPHHKLFIVVVRDRDNPQITARLTTSLRTAPEVGALLNVYKVFTESGVSRASIDVNGQEWTFCGTVVDGTLRNRQLLTVIDAYEVDMSA